MGFIFRQTERVTTDWMPLNSTLGRKTHHLCNASVGHDVAGMYQSVQHFCCLLDQVTLIRVVI